MAKVMYHVSANVQFVHLNETITVSFDNEGTNQWNEHHKKTGDLSDVKIEVYEKNAKKTNLIATVSGSITKSVYKPATVTNTLSAPHADDPPFKLTAKSVTVSANTATGTVTPDAAQRPAATWFLEFRAIIGGKEKFRSTTKIKFIALEAPAAGKKTLVFLLTPSKNPDESLKYADKYQKEIGLPVKIASSLYDVSESIANDFSIKDNEISDVRMIIHGNKIQMFCKFKNDSKANYVTSSIVETEPSTVIDSNAVTIKKKMASDARIVITGCNIGWHPELITAVRKRIFGDGGSAIYAPRYRVYFGFLNEIVFCYFVESFYCVSNNRNATETEKDNNQKADYIQQYSTASGKPSTTLETQWNAEASTYTPRQKESQVAKLSQSYNEIDFYKKFGKEPDEYTDTELRDLMYNDIMTQYVYPVVETDPENYMFSRSSTVAVRKAEIRKKWTLNEDNCKQKKSESSSMICLKLSGTGAKPNYLSKGEKIGAGSKSPNTILITGAHDTHLIISFGGSSQNTVLGDFGAKFKIGKGPMVEGDGKKEYPFSIPTEIEVYNDSDKLLDTIKIRKAKDVSATMKYKNAAKAEAEGACSIYDEKYRQLRHNAYGPYDPKQHSQEPRLSVHYRKAP
jgi:hypothetical protein